MFFPWSRSWEAKQYKARDRSFFLPGRSPVGPGLLRCLLCCPGMAYCAQLGAEADTAGTHNRQRVSDIQRIGGVPHAGHTITVAASATRTIGGLRARSWLMARRVRSLTVGLRRPTWLSALRGTAVAAMGVSVNRSVLEVDVWNLCISTIRPPNPIVAKWVVALRAGRQLVDLSPFKLGH